MWLKPVKESKKLKNWQSSDKRRIFHLTGFRFVMVMTILTIRGTAQVGGAAGTFLELANGARAFGMGGATIASAFDATAIFTNPGMIGMLYNGQLNATMARLALDRNYYDLAFTYPLNNWGNFGLGWTQLSIDNIQGRDQSGYITQYFSDLQSALCLGYARPIGDNFAIGIAGKYLYHSLAGYSAKGLSFDLGSTIYIGERITLGAVFQNINSSIKWNTSSDLKETLQSQFGLGFSYLDLFRVPNLMIATDVELAGSELWGYQAGLEYVIKNLLMIRGGYSNRGFSYGGGIQLAGFKLDVAVAPESFGNVSRIFFTLNWTFGGPPAEESYQEPVPQIEERPAEQPIESPTVPATTRNIVLILEGPLANERAEVISQNPAENTITVRLLALPGSDPITLGLNQVRFLE
jgi:hypothetical protein